ncbi:MAG: hypothetical protein QNJ64_09870 [Crocosphaera sp.]|nr:hypothetical protein [Crocosphaera sp.]
MKEFFKPKFLKKIDRYLLLNYPQIWITKIHYVLFYGLLVNITLNLLTRFFIKSNTIVDFFDNIIPYIMMFQAIFFLSWFYQQCWFSVDKEYGDTKNIDGFLQIVIYTICTLIIISSSLTMMTTAMYKVANTTPIISQNTNCNEQVNVTICNDIKEFITNNKKESDQRLHYSIYYLLHTIFAIIGIILLIIINQGGWRVLQSREFYMLMSIFVIYSTILGILLSSSLLSDDYDNIKQATEILIKSFLVYLCLVPLQKKLLNRVL